MEAQDREVNLGPHRFVVYDCADGSLLLTAPNMRVAVMLAHELHRYKDWKVEVLEKGQPVKTIDERKS